MRDFVYFIRKQGVVGLAIGFILGGAVNGVIGSLVKDILQPVISLVVGTESLSLLQVGDIMYGKFIVALLDFILLAAVVYYIFKGLGFDKLDITQDKK